MTTPDNQEPSPPAPPLTKEEIAFLIKALWTSLQAPGWTFKNRKDLEKIGEAIFSGKSLKDLDDSLYERIFPHLVTVAKHLGDMLRGQMPESPYHEISVDTALPAAPASPPPAEQVTTPPAATPSSVPTTPSTPRAPLKSVSGEK